MNHPSPSALCALILCTLLTGCHTMQSHPATPTIPADFRPAIPTACTQLILVQAPRPTSTTGHLWLLERQTTTTTWQPTFGPAPVTLGRNGLAWGIGKHTTPTPATIPLKREGDQRAPLGVFALPFTFGDSTTSPTQLPYQPMTPHHAGVDDPHSRYYNQIIDTRKTRPDWQSAESMLPSGGSYHLGIFVAHNPKNLPHSGSCIFMHLWPANSPHEPTSGCTAMSEVTMRQVLAKLRPTAHPHLIQFVSTNNTLR